MKNLDIRLYRMKIIPGKEDLAKEWLDFLKSNKVEAAETLKNENVYLESYFTAVEDGVMYVYMMIATADIAYANEIARKSENPLDIKHLEYATACVDQTAGEIMDCFCYIDNLESIDD